MLMSFNILMQLDVKSKTIVIYCGLHIIPAES